MLLLLLADESMKVVAGNDADVDDDDEAGVGVPNSYSGWFVKREGRVERGLESLA
jgi:hypothetical protein